IPHVELVMTKARERRLQPVLVPARVAGVAEEHRPLVVVETVNGKAGVVKLSADLRADQARRTSHEHAALPSPRGHVDVPSGDAMSAYRNAGRCRSSFSDMPRRSRSESCGGRIGHAIARSGSSHATIASACGA